MKEQLAKIMRGGRLTEEEAGTAMAAIMDGEATPAQIGALLACLAVRGETEDEVVGFARAMRSRAVPLSARGAVDTCGTGGDGAGTFNISTLASFVVAGCGVPVAKHGNRGSAGGCGSADILEALGVKVDAPVATVQRCLEDAGWSFLFAPAFHASTRHAVGPRRELGVRTAFNLLGPLTNPAVPEAQLVGVPRPELTEFLARCLRRLGVRRAWVVHGSGLDELSLCGPTKVTAFDEAGMRTFTVTPEDAGLHACAADDLKGGDSAANLAIARGVLDGAKGPRRDVVLLNAGAVLLMAGRAASLREGIAEARLALDNGAAATVVDRVVEICRA